MNPVAETCEQSHVAHLTRLCCGLEFGGDPQTYSGISRWLDGRVEMERPQEPNSRGAMTVADLCAARNLDEYRRRVQEWARSVWDVYASQQELARKSIQAALGARVK